MPGRRSLLLSALALTLVACSNAETGAPGPSIGSADDTGGIPTSQAPRPTDTPSAVSSATAGSGATSATGSTSEPSPASVGGVATTSPGTTTTSVATTTAAPTSTTAATTTTTTTTAAPTTTVAGQPPVVDVAAYAVYDSRSRRMLAESESGARRPVGSLMKLLVAQVAYAAGDPTRVIPAPEGLLLFDDESNIGIRPGQELARDLLIRALLKASANDAARMLAVDIAGSETAYADRMNAAAAALGLTNTRAVNATGLDADGQYSSANDMTRLAVLLMTNPSFQLAVRDPTAELNGQAFPNTNDLIGTYPGADGIKTGRTSDAGWCVIASATRENRRIIVTVLGAPSEAARNAAATALLNWGFAQP